MSGNTSMPSDRTDRRTERTRQALLAAFRALVLDQPYEALAVGDIVDRANVGRSTFYEHFESKDALLSASVSGPFRTLADLVGATDMPPALVGTMAHFRENQRVTRALLAGPSRPVLTRCLAGLIEIALAEFGRGGPAPIIPEALAALHLAGGQLTLIEHWLAAQHACPAGDLAEALFASTTAAVKALYRRP